MIQIFPANSRGRTETDWLESCHSFSFGEYYDSKKLGFRSLRVINEDKVRPSRGFGAHPHRDMEILTYVLRGELEHKDSLGTGQVLREGEMQRMTAGRGILHSEWNPSGERAVHFLQIWILPDTKGLEPEYESGRRPFLKTRNRWELAASGTKKEGSIFLHQDVELWGIRGDAGAAHAYRFRPGRFGWVQVVCGRFDLSGCGTLQSGDGVQILEEQEIRLSVLDPDAEILLFDMA